LDAWVGVVQILLGAIETNELLEDQSYEEGIGLGSRAARNTGHDDLELAPVGHFDRPKNSRR
jgi:hypothetical protein